MSIEVLNIGSRKQLFIDDACVHEASGVRRHTHQAAKHPENPLMVPEAWWESFFVQLYGNVIRDEASGQFRMWYNAVGGDDVVSVCHATSENGIHWERSRLDLLEHNGQVLTNAVLKGSYRLPTVFHTPDDPDPQRRYRMIAYTANDMVDLRNELQSGYSHGYGVFFSPDGFNWTPGAGNPVIQGSDMCTCFYDSLRREYVALVKVLSTAGGKFRRCVGVSTSRDFVNWGVVQVILSADEIDDARVGERLTRFRDILMYDNPQDYLADIYGMTGLRYEGRLLGLIWLYDRSGDRPPEHGGNDDGVINVQLVCGRDDNPYAFWDRVEDRRDVLSCGEEGSYDAGMLIPASTVIEVDDELWIYYTGCGGPHNWDSQAPDRPKFQSKHAMQGFSINLATLRRDGFVSMYASYPPGRLTTRLLTFEGSSLQVNADAEHGRILVEILDEAGHPIPGFTREDCLSVRQDAIRATVEWKGGRSVAELQGRPVQLNFLMETARLYAFQFVTG